MGKRYYTVVNKCLSDFGLQPGGEWEGKGDAHETYFSELTVIATEI